MTLKDVQKTYEDYGKDDPLYAVLSRKDTKDNKWDVEEFFASGREEIAEAMNHVAKHGVDITKGRAMDFGCGVGRLTQALCEEFDGALGVDISYSMIESAQKHNTSISCSSFLQRRLNRLFPSRGTRQRL